MNFHLLNAYYVSGSELSSASRTFQQTECRSRNRKIWSNRQTVQHSDAAPAKLTWTHLLLSRGCYWLKRAVQYEIGPSNPIHKDLLHLVTSEYIHTQVPLPNSARLSQTQGSGAMTLIVALFQLSSPLFLILFLPLLVC